MHELSITARIVEMVDRAAAGRPVRRVTIEVGRLAGVMTEAIAFCFDEVARGTALEGAALDIRHVEARARCRACGAEFPTPELWTPCGCGSLDLARLQGEELTVRSFETGEAA